MSDSASPQNIDALAQLSPGEVVLCNNLDKPEVWFYDYDAEDDTIYRFHSSTGFRRDSDQTDPQVANSLTTEQTAVEIVDIEVLEEAQQKTQPADWRKDM